MDQYIGKLLDNRYEILEVIGVGGMAVVYRAYCHRLNRFVAVKVLKNELAADAEFRRRFHDEAQAVAMLSHPNIVSVYDVSRGSDLDYIVMELIDGITLKQYMKKKNGPLGWREALHFITQIMRALSHAHGRGIIHRDIKPQNIMVLRDGSVKVADFGIARVMSAAQKTLTQEALGSVHYISPEQAKGSHLDARADIYSAGVVLYEMLTGRLPFEGDSPVSVAIQHISSIALSPRELNPDVPEALESITMHAMAQKVERRYVSAEEMLRDLEEFRKNPEVNFPYFTKDMSVQVDEPTQIMETTGGGFSTAAHQTGRRKPVVIGNDGPVNQAWPELAGGEDRGSKRKTILPIVIVSVIFFVGVAGFLWVSFFSGFFKAATTTDVPNLVGKTLTEVNADKEIRDAFEIQEVETVFSDQYPAGTIMKQDPEAGTLLKESDDHTIHVTVSGGEEYVTMIDVSNMSYSDALIALKKQGLKVATPDYEPSDTVEKGNVISFTPLEGTQIAAGETVNLTVSLGKQEKKVSVMSCIGQSLEEAKKILEGDLNLVVGTVSEISSDKPAGTVVYQSITPGTEVNEGTTITLQVSSGPEKDNSTVKTKNIPVQLPTDQEKVQVKITVGGEVKYDSVVDTTSTSTINPSVDGSGIQQVCVYINGKLVNQYDFNFDQ